MSIPEINPLRTIESLAEAELQKELSSLFILDSRAYLQRYDQIARQLQSQSWETDIQELYRCVHTIKGGAVTVAADATLQASTRLEDLLSDLRYLTPSPPLSDGLLSQILLEAGELLTGALELFGEAVADAQVEPILGRLQTLHHEVQAQYLSSWDEQKQVHQEFAEQGFDLVVLELEIALERLPADGPVTEDIVVLAQQTLEQLQKIGEGLQLASGWADLLACAMTLFDHPANAMWRSQWLHLFKALKTCVKRGGAHVEFELEGMQTELTHLGRSLADPIQGSTSSSTLISTQENQELTGSGELLASDDPSQPITNATEFNPENFDVGGFLDIFDQAQRVTPVSSESPDINLPTADADSFAPHRDSALHGLRIESASTVSQPSSSPLKEAYTEPFQSQGESLNVGSKKIQIPVPLEKLDQSAQDLVGALLTARMIRGIHHTLQNQISQMVMLAQEGARHIISLRQLQDEYALLDSPQPDMQGPTPERYRQGYITINRLLETSLKLTELGAETEKTAQQTVESLQNLDSSLLKLQNTVEDSRLVPFQNLGFRARAILRDLITRFGKPARLVIQGEQIELDVGTIRSLEPVLLHLIRNSYGHGLEPSAERDRQGKSEQGTITIALKRRGNAFQLSVKDDGRGIDPKRIHDRAETLNLPLTQTQTLNDVLAVICQPGFSAETQVSEISGRGVGMDVVATQIARLGGKLNLDTALGVGTSFYIQFPVPHLLVPCILLQAGNQVFAVPAEDIKTMTLVDTLDAKPTNEEMSSPLWTVQPYEETNLAVDLLRLWRPYSSPRSLPESAIGVYVSPQDVEVGVWLVADELLGQSELLISPLPSPLNTPDGIMGVSLQADGRLVPVLEANVVAEQLLDAFAKKAEFIVSGPPLADHEVDDETQTILIVDDAALIRRRLEGSLNAYGYPTQTCADGLEAWSWIQKHPRSALIITDIEMPNMDGFTLINRCRQAGVITPILVISSRLSEDWSNEAKRVGATDYLNKGFSTVELINKVTTLLNSANQYQ